MSVGITQLLEELRDERLPVSPVALIISSALGVRTGEWKGTPGPFKTMLGGIAILILAICILGFSNSL